MTEPNKELIEALKAMLKPKAPVEIYKMVEGTGVSNNLTFSEAGLLKEVSSKKPKTERKRPEFTFEDGFHFNFYLERRKCYSGLDNYKLFYQISGDSVGVFDKDRICYVIKMVQQALDQSSEICSTWEHKSLRKKLKLYIKWLQSEMSKQGE